MTGSVPSSSCSPTCTWRLTASSPRFSSIGASTRSRMRPCRPRMADCPAHADERGGWAHGCPGRRPPPGKFLRRAGLLLGGVPGTPAAKVTIIGSGVAGTEAAKMALGLRAIVRVLGTNAARLSYLSDVFSGRLDLVVPNRARTAAYVAESDVVIGAVLVAGAESAETGDPRHDQEHAARQCRSRHRHRPGRLLQRPAGRPRTLNPPMWKRVWCTAWPTSPAP